jgi:hypothetical protein
LIIVEGPDGAGKTTLIEQIEDIWDIKRQGRVVDSRMVVKRDLPSYIDKELEKGFGWRLYDRFALISSPMYIPVGNDRTFKGEFLDPIWLTRAYQKLWHVDPVILLCLPEMEVVRKNIIADRASPDPKIVVTNWKSIYLNYHNWYCSQRAEGNTSLLKWDYTDPQPDKLQALMKWAQARVDMGRKWRIS